MYEAVYLLKDRLVRLAHSVSQALDRNRPIEEKRQAEQRLFLETFSRTRSPAFPIARCFWTDWIGSTGSPGVSPAICSAGYISIGRVSRCTTTAWGLRWRDFFFEVSQRLLRRVRSADTVPGWKGKSLCSYWSKLQSPLIQLQEFAMPFTVEGREIVLTAHGLCQGMKAAQQSRAMPRGHASGQNRRTDGLRDFRSGHA